MMQPARAAATEGPEAQARAKGPGTSRAAPTQEAGTEGRTEKVSEKRVLRKGEVPRLRRCVKKLPCRRETG